MGIQNDSTFVTVWRKIHWSCFIELQTTSCSWELNIHFFIFIIFNLEIKIKNIIRWKYQKSCWKPLLQLRTNPYQVQAQCVIRPFQYLLSFTFSKYKWESNSSCQLILRCAFSQFRFESNWNRKKCSLWKVSKIVLKTSRRKVWSLLSLQFMGEMTSK